MELAEGTGYSNVKVSQMLLGKEKLAPWISERIWELTGKNYCQQGRDWAAMREKWLEHRRQNYRFKKG
jgi:hypothetical protein